MERKGKHPRTQSCDRFSQRHGWRALWIWNLGFPSCGEASEISNNNLTNDYKIEAIALARDPGIFSELQTLVTGQTNHSSGWGQECSGRVSVLGFHEKEKPKGADI